LVAAAAINDASCETENPTPNSHAAFDLSITTVPAAVAAAVVSHFNDDR